MQNAPELSSKPASTRAPTTRREILCATLALPFLPAAPLAGRTRARQAPIDRRELVSRHDIVLTAADVESPLQVGNGELAMTVDVTGLQTLFRDYERGMPLGTLAQWAWHAFPPPAGVDLDDIYTLYASHGRMVPYADGRRPFDTEAAPDTPEAAVWRRANPHRVHLGRLAFVRPASERAVTLAEVKSPLQELHLTIIHGRDGQCFVSAHQGEWAGGHWNQDAFGSDGGGHVCAPFEGEIPRDAGAHLDASD